VSSSSNNQATPFLIKKVDNESIGLQNFLELNQRIWQEDFLSLKVMFKVPFHYLKTSSRCFWLDQELFSKGLNYVTNCKYLIQPEDLTIQMLWICFLEDYLTILCYSERIFIWSLQMTSLSKFAQICIWEGGGSYLQIVLR